MSKPPFEDLFVCRHGRRNRKSFIVPLLIQIGVSLTVFAMAIVMQDFRDIVISIVSTVEPYLPAGLEWIRGIDPPNIPDSIQGVFGLVGFVVAILAIISQFALMSQRCRDMNLSGWFVLLNFVPVVSMIFQIVLLVRPGTRGGNRFGPDPLGSGLTLEK